MVTQKFFIVALLGLFLIPSLLIAQQGRGTITGVVSDPSGGVIPGIEVTATNMGTTVKTVTLTTEEGAYAIPFLPAGPYEVSVVQPGFRKYIRSGVTVSVNSTVTLNIQLEIGETSEVVQVTGEAPLLETATSDLGVVIDNRTYTNLPLNVAGNRRDPVGFIFLAPGVTGDSFSAQVNGGISFGNELWIAGAPAGLAGLGASARPAQFSTSVDAIKEFKVTTNNYSADMGRAAGVLNLEYKSGTNEFHGTAYEFARNDVFDARGFFPSRKPRSRQHEFGFNIGGPVILPKLYNGRGKTFFFFDFNGYINRPGAAGFRVTIPTKEMKAGDFRGIAPIYDPATSRTLDDGSIVRNRFQCNGQVDVICPDRISAPSRKLLELLPDPEFPGLANNYQGKLPGAPATNNYAFTVRFDHAQSERQNISITYSGGPLESSPSAGNINGLLGPLTAARDFEAFETVARVSHTYSLSPNLVNHATLGFNRDATFFVDPEGGTDWPGRLGLKGLVPRNTMISVNFLTDGLVPLHPSTFVGGFLENNNSWTFQEQLNWIKGTHSFKFGLDVRKLGVALWVAETPGSFDFSSQATSLGGKPGTGHSFASFLLGAANSASQTIDAAGTTNDLWWYFAGFVQDDIKLTSNLTVNLGLRYDLPFGRFEQYDRHSSLDPNLPNPGVGNFPGALTFAGFGPGKCNCRSFTETDYKEFGPRLGFAYQLHPKFVLRGGYGIFYIPGGNLGGNSTRGGPIGWRTTPVVLSPNAGVTPALLWDDGFPQNFIPPPRLIPEFANGGSINWIIHENGFAPQYQNWNLNLQHQLSETSLISLAYAGSKGTDLPEGLFNPNQVDSKWLALGNLLGANINSPQAQKAIADRVIPDKPYPSFNGSVAQSLRRFPQYAGLSVPNSLTGNSTYHSFQVELQKRYSNGLQFLASYTAAKSLDSAGSMLNGFFGSSGRDHFNRKLEKSLSVNDIPQNLVVNYTYELPIGPGKPHLNSGGPLGKVLEGWRISGISTYRKGVPIEVVVTNRLNLFNGRNNPDLVSGASPRSNISLDEFDVFGGKHSYVDPAAFKEPAPFTIGNAPRTFGNLRQPAYYNEDVSIAKVTRLSESTNLEFRWEMFNVLNRTVFFLNTTLRGFPLNFSAPAAFGRISGQANARRQMQFSLKLNF